MLAKIKDIVAKAARRVGYGRPEEGGVWRLWWQNHSKMDGEGDVPLRGSAWLHMGPDQTTSLRLSWSLRSWFAHVDCHVDPMEAEIGFKLALPPVALWLSATSWPLLSELTKRLGEREVRLSAHDGCVGWTLWANPNRWSECDPWWRHGSVDVLRALLGEEQVTKTPIAGPVPVKVPLPEGVYDGTCTMTLVRVGRPRWVSVSYRTAQITMETPIPIPGKGENAWDIEDDALYAQSAPARSVADAVSHVVQSVLTTRESRAGRDWRPSVTAAAPVAQA